MPYNPYFQNFFQQYQPQQGSFIHVQSERQAREYAVAPNSSVTFIDDNLPYVYTKSMGMSQFDAPVFRRFKLIEEHTSNSGENAQEPPSNTQEINLDEYMTKAEFEPFKAVIEKIQKELIGNEPTE